MGFSQYHEPARELPQETRTLARMIVSLIEEAQAIDWYSQRMAVEQNQDALDIMRHAQAEEFLHFAMDLEFSARQMPGWRKALQQVLFKPGSIMENAEKGEDAVPGA